MCQHCLRTEYHFHTASQENFNEEDVFTLARTYAQQMNKIKRLHARNM